MKRQHVLAGYAAVSLLLSGLATHQWMLLRHHSAVNAAVAAVPEVLDNEAFNTLLEQTDSQQPAALRFARASALSRGGELDLAESHLAELMQLDEPALLAAAARYNLANGYLREALRSDPASGRYRSLLELAKQRYRDLLERQPDHWPARFNLELALRLVPEEETYEVDDKGKPIKSVSVIFPGFEDRELP